MFSSLYGNYRQLKFSQVFPSVEVFNEAMRECPLDIDMSDKGKETTYYLLYARYGNDIVASSDLNRFKMNLFSIMFSYGPTWSKRLDIQKQLRELTVDELKAGGGAIYNSAYNDGTNPSTASLDELPYINSQNQTRYKKSTADAYILQYTSLSSTVTEEYIRHFKKLFLNVVQPEKPLWYVTEGDIEL